MNSQYLCRECLFKYSLDEIPDHVLIELGWQVLEEYMEDHPEDFEDEEFLEEDEFDA